MSSHNYLHRVLCHLAGDHMALSDVHIVKKTVTRLCFSQSWCRTMPGLWEVAQILPYNPPGTSASWYLIFNRSGFFQAFWLVILHGLFVVALIFPYSHCLQISWLEVTSCSKVQPLLQCLCTSLSDCRSGNLALLLGRSTATAAAPEPAHPHFEKFDSVGL